MQVAKWGNSLAVRLPAALVEALDLKPGDDIQINVAGDGSFNVTRPPTRADWLARLRAHRGTLPDGFSFDRDAAHDR